MLRSYTEDDLTQIKLVASDMDLTLLADDGSMPSNMDARIAALEQAGITFAAASGRPLYTLRNMFPSSHERMALVPDNGAAVVCRGELVFTSLIEQDLISELVAFTLERTADGVPVICGLDAAYVPATARHYDAVIREFYHEVVYVERIEDVRVKANKYTVYFPQGGSVPMRDELFGPAFGERLFVTCGGLYWIDIMNLGVNKGTGIARLCEHLGISMADALACGDTDNDAEMLKAVGHGYLMANAEKRFEPCADFRAPSNNDRGVAQVIDAVLAARG